MSYKIVDGKVVREVTVVTTEDVPEDFRAELVAEQARLVNEVQERGVRLEELKAEIAEFDAAAADLVAPSTDSESAPVDPTVIPVVEG